MPSFSLSLPFADKSPAAQAEQNPDKAVAANNVAASFEPQASRREESKHSNHNSQVAPVLADQHEESPRLGTTEGERNSALLPIKTGAQVGSNSSQGRNNDDGPVSSRASGESQGKESAEVRKRTHTPKGFFIICDVRITSTLSLYHTRLPPLLSIHPSLSGIFSQTVPDFIKIEKEDWSVENSIW